jgi:2-polyprenyl-6-methoxyphenol hydroxylase-like FAD-dependent oxidoreductase
MSPDQQRVTGVQIEDRRMQQVLTFEADLVVDATGRGSPTPKWLTALGYTAPEEEIVKVGVTYTTRPYRRTVGDEQALAYLCSPVSGQERRGGSVFPIDDNRWIVTLSGRHGEAAPTDEPGFLEYARSLPSQDMYHLIQSAKPAGDIVVYKYPASRRRRYELLQHLPARLVVIGDAVCSFNPVYGQGMTVAALEAVTLQGWWQAAVARGQEPDSLDFFQAIAQVIETPWKLSTEAEKEFLPEAQPTSWVAKWLRSYFARLRQTSQHDPVVALAFIRVTQLLAPPASLFKPHIMGRVLFAGRRHQRAILASAAPWRTQAA